jgi:hypothetical protein
LKLQQVPTEEVLLALNGTDNTEMDLGNINLGWWQDFILVSWERK